MVLYHHRETPSMSTGCATAGRRRSHRACHATTEKRHRRRDKDESWLRPLVVEGLPPPEPSREGGPRYCGWGHPRGRRRSGPRMRHGRRPLCTLNLESATKRGTPWGLHPSYPMLLSASVATREIQQQRCRWVERVDDDGGS